MQHSVGTLPYYLHLSIESTLLLLRIAEKSPRSLRRDTVRAFYEMVYYFPRCLHMSPTKVIEVNSLFRRFRVTSTVVGHSPLHSKDLASPCLLLLILRLKESLRELD